ncbi:MAG: SDR family oxidoreductase [Pseudomonadota bacterium]
MSAPVALITGAARGIGLATAKLLLEDRYRVVLLDRDGDELKAVVETLEGEVFAETVDVSDPDAVAALAVRIDAQFGALSVLVNNAGVANFGPIEETDFARWRRVMETNLDGVFLMTQAMTTLLAKGADTFGNAAIVNIASISGLRASTLRVAYGTSKAAVIQLTLQQAAELGEKGIRANCIAPGPVNTKLALAVHSDEIRAAYHDAIPLNRYGSEMEIAEGIRFLTSPKASYITGQTLAVDGGFEAVGIGLPALRD